MTRIDKPKESYIDKILQDIFNLNKPSIEDSRKVELHDFIKMTINGDSPKEYFAINANLDNGDEGAVVYILTNTRLIKVDIGINGEVQSSSFIFDSIINIKRKLLSDGRAEIEVLFQNGSFGLRYQNSDKKISDFFQAMDQLRIKNG